MIENGEGHKLVALARELERHMARRRKLTRELRSQELHIRRLRKFIRDLAAPTTQPVTWGEKGELL